MPKYRLLSLEELKALEPDFIQFLAVQGISADLWLELKQSKSDKIEELIALFSDIVLEKVYAKPDYLSVDQKGFKASIKCDNEGFEIVGIRTNADSNRDEPYFASGKYLASKPEDVFAFIKMGAQVGNVELHQYYLQLAERLNRSN